jgi:hypothetical protein
MREQRWCIDRVDVADGVLLKLAANGRGDRPVMR